MNEFREDRMSNYYDSAQVCLNGHLINDYFHEYPEENQDYCGKCGEVTIYRCPDCKTEIRGSYYEAPSEMGNAGGNRISYVPNYCSKCGKMYPWTVKKLEAVREMIDELKELTFEDKEKFKNSLDDIIAKVPKTKSATLSFKKILKKLGKDSYESIKSILVDIVSEVIKNKLFSK